MGKPALVAQRHRGNEEIRVLYAGTGKLNSRRGVACRLSRNEPTGEDTPRRSPCIHRIGGGNRRLVASAA